MPIDHGSRKGYARAGREGHDGPSPQGSEPHDSRRSLSRDTIPEASFDTAQVRAVCRVARGLGYAARKLLDVWEESVGPDTPFADEITNDLAGASRLLTSMTYDFSDRKPD